MQLLKGKVTNPRTAISKPANDRRPFGMRTNDLLIAGDRRPMANGFCDIRSQLWSHALSVISFITNLGIAVHNLERSLQVAVDNVTGVKIIWGGHSHGKCTGRSNWISHRIWKHPVTRESVYPALLFPSLLQEWQYTVYRLYRYQIRREIG